MISENYIKNPNAIHLIKEILDIYFIDNKNLKYFLGVLGDRYKIYNDKGFISNNSPLPLADFFKYASNSTIKGYSKSS